MERVPDHPVIRSMEATGYPTRERPPIWNTCDWCGGQIYDGDEYFDIHGEIICFDCATDCLKRAGDDG